MYQLEKSIASIDNRNIVGMKVNNQKNQCFKPKGESDERMNKLCFIQAKDQKIYDSTLNMKKFEFSKSIIEIDCLKVDDPKTNT